jgi:LytS/YehU family sensor histidine kinase
MITFKMVQFGAELSTASAIIPFILNVIANALAVYLIIFRICPAYYQKNVSKRRYVGLLMGLLITATCLKVAINGFADFIFYGKWFVRSTLADLTLLEFILVLFFIIQAILYCSIKEWIKVSFTNRRLNEEKLLLELKYLKSQINPHFLFNTLNNLYSLAITNSDQKTADGIGQLSQMMRYMLNDEISKEILLDKEIEYLKSYIELQKLRFSDTDDISIAFSCQGETAGVMVPPFLFVGFIENAFKYGIDYRMHSFIDIRFVVNGQSLLFTASNTIAKSKAYPKHGIGLANIRERLNLIYPHGYQLNIHQTGGTFHVALEIKHDTHAYLYH